MGKVAGDKIPEGVVMANDLDTRRASMLVHRARRLASPALLVINENALHLNPLPLPDGKDLYFDNILCDVVCSGDGTLRKNSGLWKNYHPR